MNNDTNDTMFDFGSNELVFAFDIGTGSLGFAARKGENILDAKSILIDAEYGKRDEERARIRAFRTRQSHLLREKFLKSLCLEVGIPILEGRKNGKKGDPRLEREFPKRGDSTVYNSALLRVMLLDGKRLEGWQIYKALHSAIQRRGFDKNVPWKARHSDKDDSDTAGRASAYMEEMKAVGAEYPCQYQAYQMGLWSPHCGAAIDTPRITHKAKSSRDKVIPRELAAKELTILLVNASQQIPLLASKMRSLLQKWDIQPDPDKNPMEQAAQILIFGANGTPYASYYAELQQKYGLKEVGNKNDFGLLGQYIPRFDNRMVKYCALIPRFQVARAMDVIIYEAVFVLKLKNLRVYRNGDEEDCLSAAEIRVLLDEARERAKSHYKELKDELKTEKKQEIRAAVKANFLKKIAEDYKLKKTVLKKWAKEHKLRIATMDAEVAAPKTSGRSNYSRAAARLIVELVRLGKNPMDFYNDIASDPAKIHSGLTVADLRFIQEIKGDWKNLYIPALPISGKFGTNPCEDDVDEILARTNTPLITIRLNMFRHYLKQAIARYGKPDKIVFEFVREDFMGKEAKKKYEIKLRDNRKKRENARQLAEEMGIELSHNNLRKVQLLMEQGWKDPYNGETLCWKDPNTGKTRYWKGPYTGKILRWKDPYNGETLCWKDPKTDKIRCNLSPDDLEVDHIVPRARGGADSWNNTVVTTRACNQEKRDQTPYEWLSGRSEWKSYCDRIEKSHLSPLKKMLLTSKDAADSEQKKDDLAGTAYIARLARDVACAICGWQPGEAKEKQHIIVVNGAATYTVRNVEHLNQFLLSAEEQEELEKMDKDKRNKSRDKFRDKFRGNKKHHALDAMVLSYMTAWYDNKYERHHFKLPDGSRQIIKAQLEKVVPFYHILPKPALEETFYGTRIDPQNPQTGKQIVVARVALCDFGVTYNEFDQKKALRKVDSIPDPDIREAVRSALQSNIYTRESWLAFCGSFTHPKIGELRAALCCLGDTSNEFDLKKAQREAESILDPVIKEAVQSALKPDTTRKSWLAFCSNFTHPKTGGKVIKVQCVSNKSDLKEYVNMAKEHNEKRKDYNPDSTAFRGQYKRGKQHQGYYIYLDKKGTPRVQPVHVYASKYKIAKEMQASGNKVIGFYQSGCLIELKESYVHGTTTIPEGRYVLSSVWVAGQFKLDHPEYKGPYPLAKVNFKNPENFRRVDE